MLFDGFTSHRSPDDLRVILETRGLAVSHERLQDGAVVTEAQGACHAEPGTVPSRGEACHQIVEDYAVGDFQARLHLFFFERRLVEVRIYPDDVPGFHRHLSEQLNLTLFAEHRIVEGEVRIGAHLDAGGYVSYFWQHTRLSEAHEDWLRAESR